MSSTPRSRLSVGGAMLGGGESSSSGATQTSVQVAVRIRPVTEQDLQSIPSRWRRSILNPLSATSLAVEPGGPPGEGATAASGPSKRQAFSFDRVLSPEDGQAQVYATVQTLIPRFLEGYNATILAYGQTSSGKSYTMGTASGDVDFESLVAGQAPDPQMGIIPRAVAQIFAHIKQTQARSGAVQFSARASFIEIYNEELIDLLADTVDGSRPHVQIREDKAGHIIWSGLREVPVKTVADVMNHLLQGSSVRRTHETEMNAQSSRSHAIFSLTLTQRKYVGGSTPPPPSAMRPMSTVYGGRTTPTGRTTPSGRSSSSGLPRPASGIPTPGRQSMASPTPGSRASTPSMYASGGLRPASVAGHLRVASPLPDEAGKDGEWVTITSKFHFVDLAGSERLKRTAAMGDRAKEGISINAGLHALGNVISALGDPAKAKRTTHIPYRDSKLTRLLQDSLGGNAHTLMIACVSPTEYNVSETVNTLQYANRARNIKNKAELNEVEVGWDDVEHLQAVVLKLRKELAALKAASKGAPGGAAALRAIEQKDELEWREKYTTLSQRHSQLTAELTKLQQLTKGQTSNEMSDDFLAAAEPIIVEYEKTVDSLEGQINLMKAALAHSEDLITEQEASLAEQEARAAAAEQALEAREATLLELQARLAKLHDRESSNDGYVRELETQLQTITTQGDSDSQVLAELRKELVRLRQGEGQTEQYVKELEARLAKADESATSLSAQVERLEADLTRREEAFVELSQRQDTADMTKQTKELFEELDGRDLKLLDLEKRLDELRDERDEAVRERGRLNESMAAHELERGELEDRIRELQTAAAAAGALALGAGAGAAVAVALDDDHPAASRDVDPVAQASADASEAKLVALQQDVEALREAETKARAEGEALNAKYRESLAEIHYLNQQVTELKLSNGAPRTPKPNGVGEDDLEVLASSSDVGADDVPSAMSRRESTQFSPSSSRAARMNGSKRPESLLLDRVSLSRRSSGSFVGYNPRDRTPRENSALSPLHAPAGADALPVSAAAESSPASGHVRTRSLSQHDAFTGGRRPLSLASSILPSGLKIAGANGDLSSPSPLSSGYERQIASLEKETMRLQEVLRERDEEIAALEAASKARNNSVPEIRTMHTSESHSTLASDGTGTDGASDSDALYVQALSRQESQQSTASAPLTPITEREIASIKQLIAETREEQTDGSEGITRFDDLMRSMARKETTHRERIEELTQELGTQKRDYEALQQLSRDQAANMAQEIENLRARLSESDGLLGTPRAAGVALGTAGLGAAVGAAGAMALQQDKPQVPNEVDEPVSEATRAAPSNDEAFKAEASRLAADLEQAKEQLSAREKAFEEQLQAARDDHASMLSGRATEHEQAQAELARAHTEAVARQAAEHQELARQTIAQHEQAIASLQEEHALALASAQEREAAAVAAAREAALQDAQREHAVALEQLQGSHAEELQRVQAQAAEGAQQLVSDHSRGLDALRDEHRSATEASSSAHAAALAATVAAVHEEHARSLNESDAETRQRHVEALEEHKLAADERLAKDLAAAKLAHDAELSSLQGEHGTISAHLDELKAAHAAQQEQHAANLAAAVAQRESDVSKLASEHELAVLGLQAQHEQALGAQAEAHDAALRSLRSEHEQIVAALREGHESAAQEQIAAHEAQLQALRTEHEANVAQLNADNDAATASLLNVHGLALTGLREQLEASSAAKLSDRSDRNALLASHSEALRSSEEQLSQARLAHEQAIESLKSEHATVLVAAQSAAAASAQADHIAALDGLRAEHATALDALQTQHGEALASAEREASEARQALASLQDEHAAQLAQVRSDHAAASDSYMRERAALQEEHASAQQQVKELMTAHSRRLNALTEEHSSKLKELEDSHRQQHDELQHAHAELEDRHRDLLEQNPHEVEVLRTELAETSDALVTLEAALTEAQEERDRFAEELEMLRGPDAEGNVHQELAALRKNLDQQQAILANARSDLLRTKSDIQGLLEERARQDSLLCEAQIKLTIAETRNNRSRDSGSTNNTPPSEGYASATGEFTPANGRSRSPMPRRGSDDQVASSSDHRGSGSRNLSVSTNKPPPLTPPPNMPPPPTPVAAGGTTPTQRQTSGARTSTSSILSRPDSPEGLTRSSSVTSITASNPSLSGLAQSDIKTAKLLSDQAEEIKSLAKQLNHCEQDLQANIDLVATLEAALNDSERNLRKSRVQLSEVTRERDRYSAQADELRAQVSAAQQEADSARNSVLAEKQSYESRLQAEREAKEKARRALEARLEEVQKKKNSKLFCM